MTIAVDWDVTHQNKLWNLNSQRWRWHVSAEEETKKSPIKFSLSSDRESRGDTNDGDDDETDPKSDEIDGDVEDDDTGDENDDGEVDLNINGKKNRQ